MKKNFLTVLTFMLLVGQANATTASRTVVLKGAGEDVVSLQVEVASTPQEQAQGLMFRKELPKGTGMIFPFSPPRYVSFWMKNTLIPLDIVFLDEQGKVAQIERKTEPYSLDPIPSDFPVSYVLELAAGEAERLGINVGDTLAQ